MLTMLGVVLACVAYARSKTAPIENPLPARIRRRICNSSSNPEPILSGSLCDLEDEVFVVAVATAAPDDGAKVAVDRLDDAEGDLVSAVREDAIEVCLESAGELLERGEPLPAQTSHPRFEEAPRRALVGVAPEAVDLFLEVVRLEEEL